MSSATSPGGDVTRAEVRGAPDDSVDADLELADLPEEWELPEDPEPFVSDGKFRVRLDNFEGPFDLLLTLINRRQLDVTEVALSQVTDDFIAYLTAAGDEFDLGQATEFLVVAATLLDL